MINQKFLKADYNEYIINGLWVQFVHEMAVRITINLFSKFIITMDLHVSNIDMKQNQNIENNITLKNKWWNTKTSYW